MPIHDGRVCASVPVSALNCAIVFCHRCREWTVHVTLTSMHDDERTDLHYSRIVPCGPFDDIHSTIALLGDQIVEALRVPGVPGFTAPSL